MMSRCTSLVPPPKVRISAERCIRSIRPARTAPGESVADRARSRRAPPSAAGRPRWRTRCRTPWWPRRRPGRGRAPASRGAIRQLISLRNSALACTRARLSCTHSASITRWPLASLVCCGPLADLAQRREDRRRRGQRDPLVVELVGDQRPALVLLADQGGGRHADVRSSRWRWCRARPWCAPASRRSPSAVGGHDEHRQALVPGRVRVGAAGQPHVVGVLDQAGPHLLAVDHVARRRRGPRGCAATARSVPASGLGVADREVDLARGDPGQEERLLLRRCRSA